MPAQKAAVYVANQSFAAVVNGEQVWVKAGDRAEKGAAIIKGREDFWDPEDEHPPRFLARPALEQATSAPGEKRGA